MAMIVEYARSGRSACKLCKLEVSKGEMRIGLVSRGTRGFDLTNWHHFRCLSEMNSGKVSDITQAKGFTQLKDSDQLLLRNMFTKEVSVKVSVKRTASEESGEQGASPKRLKEARYESYDKARWMELLAGFEPSKFSSRYKDASLPSGWKAFASMIVNEPNGVSSERIAAFDFDGCLVNTDVRRVGATAWSLMYKSIPQKLRTCHEEGFKLVVFTNESNIDRWTKSRQKAVDSKIGRLKLFMELVNLPMQVLIACGKEGSGDPCRKPAPGMWEFMEKHMNNNVCIDRQKSFYVGDAAGRPKDHSDADLGFAKEIGLPFLVPEDYFDIEDKS